MCGIGEMAISGHCWVCSGVLGKPVGGEALPGTAAQPHRKRCLFLDRHLQWMQKPLENVGKEPADTSGLANAETCTLRACNVMTERSGGGDGGGGGWRAQLNNAIVESSDDGGDDGVEWCSS